jgi:small subunit ribosomal protein S17
MAEETKEEVTTTDGDNAAEASASGEGLAKAESTDTGAKAGDAKSAATVRDARRAEKIGVVSSDKMQKSCVVRVDRLIKHPKYRRYVRRTSKFMAHNEQGATVGDKVRIVETRPMSAHKRWRIVEIIQKAEK